MSSAKIRGGAECFSPERSAPFMSRSMTAKAGARCGLTCRRLPCYWVKPPAPLSAVPGLHRFYWDMHMEPLKDVEPEYPMQAVFQKTAAHPTGPWVVPGDYSVVLTAGGKTFTQSLTVKIDPRL